MSIIALESGSADLASHVSMEAHSPPTHPISQSLVNHNIFIMYKPFKITDAVLVFFFENQVIERLSNSWKVYKELNQALSLLRQVCQ